MEPPFWGNRSADTSFRVEAVMSLRLFEIIAALIAGAVALLVLKMIGLIVKFALIIALLITLAAWLAARAISAKFTTRNS